MEALWKVEASAWAVRGGGCKEHPLQRKKTVRYQERTTIICRSLPVLEVIYNVLFNPHNLSTPLSENQSSERVTNLLKATEIVRMHMDLIFKTSFFSVHSTECRLPGKASGITHKWS